MPSCLSNRKTDTSSPLAMTDGAARLIECNVDSIKDPVAKKKVMEVYQKLISKNPKEAWTSGQWVRKSHQNH